MTSSDAPLSTHISLLSIEDLELWCIRSDVDRRRISSIEVGGTTLPVLLGRDAKFPEVATLEVCNWTPSALPTDFCSLLPSAWPKVQTLIACNDALHHIRVRKLHPVSNLVVKPTLGTAVIGAGDVFYQNVVAFQPISLSVQNLPHTQWHAIAGSLVGPSKCYILIFHSYHRLTESPVRVNNL